MNYSSSTTARALGDVSITRVAYKRASMLFRSALKSECGSVLIALTLFTVVFFPSLSFANDWKLVNQSPSLSAAPAGGEAENATGLPNGVQPLSVYSRRSKIPLASDPMEFVYKVVKRDSKWTYVTFQKPTVLAWVSSEFVTSDARTGQLKATDRLRLRINPNMDSRILGFVQKGGVLVSSKNTQGQFIGVYAPLSFEFALDSASLKTFQSDLTQNEPRVEPNISVSTANRSVGSFLKESNFQGPGSEGSDLERMGNNEAKVDLPPLDPPKPKLLVVANTAQPPKPVLGALVSGDTGYKIAAGDAISLQVFGEPDLSASSLRVPLTGQVGFPLIGTIKVSGMRIDQVEREVKRRLQSGYIKDPRLSVTIAEYRPVFVKGAVKKVGQFPYAEGLDVARLLVLAELKSSAKRNSVSLSRDNKVIAEGLPVDSGVQVKPGDVISVEQEFGTNSENNSAFVYLHGEVKNPGAYEFVRGLTVEKAVVLAGGFSLRASKKRISITREVPNQLVPQTIKKAKLFEPVQPDDIIDVGASWF